MTPDDGQPAQEGKRRRKRGKDTRPRWKILLMDWLRPLFIALLILTPIRSSIADWNDVPSGSMKPSILVGDRIFVNKLAYGLRFPLTRHWITRWDEPKPGDIVICYNPNTNQRLVKRVVAVGGDIIEVRRGDLFINGERPTYFDLDKNDLRGLSPDELAMSSFYAETLAGERPGSVPHNVMRTPLIRRLFGPPDTPLLRVPHGSVYVMGDNREQSSDSRVFGVISVDRVVGQVGRVVVSVDPENYFLPRGDRFFKSLP
ncbi:MAG: signal peptidase I [Planctomycetota bacterium]